MVKYPIKKANAVNNTAKKSVMTVKGVEKDNSIYSRRGMQLEHQIELTLEFYRLNEVAVIHKKPTPVQIVKFSKEKSKYTISEAYFRQASTTDYNGIFRGKYIDFEAKETKNLASLNLDNIQDHQLKHMLQVKKHGGIAFVIVCFWRVEEIYIVDVDFMAKWYYDPNAKSIPLAVFRKEGARIASSYTKPIDFIPTVEKLYFEN